jgi:hypothetical protein
VPETVVDARPPVRQKPITASAVSLLESYYRISTFIMAIEEKAPLEWAGERILGVRKRRAQVVLREIASHGDLESWFRNRVLAGMRAGRIGRGRETRPCPVADAFFVALAGGVPEARSCALSLAGATRAQLNDVPGDDPDQAVAEVRDYLVHSGLLWRLDADGD